ncbi:hypothetical protein PR048_006167 [Dryococelus australis]|uniref:Uncharacterized protein n=1 Tax=Dryococelus australis TaxID=614101 RepID=A0ABQ9IA79_9NEOP|nr:hypothetical protein PR048_006167 [Dryococelus australis]
MQQELATVNKEVMLTREEVARSASDIRELENRVKTLAIRTESQSERKHHEEVGKLTTHVSQVEERIENSSQIVDSLPNLQLVRSPHRQTRLVTEEVNTPSADSSLPANAINNASTTQITNQVLALLHHPAKLWMEKLPTFEAKSGENHVEYLLKLEEYSKFRSSFLKQFWNKKIQGNLQAKLHAERFYPGKGKTLEEHMSEVYDKSRHLTPPVSDEEFAAMILHQLPYKYRTHWSGRLYQDLASFREGLLEFDRIERLQRSQFIRDGDKNNQADKPPPSTLIVKPKGLCYRMDRHILRTRVHTTMVPASITSTLSESMIVLILWAMVRNVQFLNFLLIVFWIIASVLQHTNVVQHQFSTACSTCRLQYAYSLWIHVGRGFVHDKDPVVPDDGTCKADKLSLSCAEVAAPRFHPKRSIDSAFAVPTDTECRDQDSFCRFAPREVSVLAELAVGHLRNHLTDVPPQSNSPPSSVLGSDHVGGICNPSTFHKASNVRGEEGCYWLIAYVRRVPIGNDGFDLFRLGVRSRDHVTRLFGQLKKFVKDEYATPTRTYWLQLRTCSSSDGNISSRKAFDPASKMGIHSPPPGGEKWPTFRGAQLPRVTSLTETTTFKEVTVVERLARSPPTKANRVQSQVGSPEFLKWESCRTMPLVDGFSRGSPIFPASLFWGHSIYTSITLIGSQDLAVKSRSNHSQLLIWAGVCNLTSLITYLKVNMGGSSVVVRLLTSHQGKPGSIPCGVTWVFVCGKRVGRCRCSAVRGVVQCVEKHLHCSNTLSRLVLLTPLARPPGKVGLVDSEVIRDGAFAWSDFGKPWKTEIRMAGPDPREYESSELPLRHLARYLDDNAKCHVSRAIMQWYSDNNLPRLDWPIEHLWDELDCRVRARQERPKSIPQLMELLQEEWRRILVDVLQKLVESMPDRVAAVIAARACLSYSSLRRCSQSQIFLPLVTSLATRLARPLSITKTLATHQHVNRRPGSPSHYLYSAGLGLQSSTHPESSCHITATKPLENS